MALLFVSLVNPYEKMRQAGLYCFRRELENLIYCALCFKVEVVCYGVCAVHHVAARGGEEDA